MKGSRMRTSACRKHRHHEKHFGFTAYFSLEDSIESNPLSRNAARKLGIKENGMNPFLLGKVKELTK